MNNTATATKIRSNKFAGRCACGTQVAAGAGHLAGKNTAGRWVTQCLTCAGAPIETAAPTVGVRVARTTTTTRSAPRTTRFARKECEWGDCHSFGIKGCRDCGT